MSVSSGTRLGPYEVLGPLGAGGMGEVYRARDTRLDRTVAIKVLPSHLSSNPDLRARLEREAKAVSSLNHPHICTLHDVGQQDGTDYIVMELVEGETLLDRLKKGPLPLDQTLRYGIQIADALDKAHRQGVIHRDLKPGNVMLTKAGSKLMDFGLAKRGASGDGGGGVSTLETREKPLTEAGSLLGTYQYMSPEQLEGREADARTDIWALGCVVYEMTTGKRAFQGKSQASLISAIMTGEPQPIGQLQPMTPPALERLVRVCLAKEPDDRMQTAHDVMQELKWITEAGEGASAAVIARRAFALPWFGIALAAGVAAGAAGMHLLTSRPVPRPSLLLSILPPVGGTIGQWVAISPDGRQIAFDVTRDGKRQLWLRALAESDPRPLAGTEDAFVPFWSPDNRSLAFFSRGKLKRLDLDGSPPRALADAPAPRGGAWGRDGNIIYTPGSNSPLLRVAATGGAVSEATKLGEGHYGHRWPSFLPDGRRFVFTVWSASPSKRGIYFGSVDSREVRFLQNSPRRAAFVGDRLIFAAGEALLTRPFDPDRLEPKGESTSLSNSVSWDADLWGHSSFSVSHGGIVAYRSGAPRYRFVWYDRSGHPTAAGPPDAIIGSLQESPDERMLAFDSLDSLDLESDAFGIWLFDLARNTTTRVTSGQVAMNPLWSSDGSSLIYRSDREEGFLILRKSLRGEGQEEVLWKDDTNWFTPYDLSRDDRFLLYGRPHPQNRLDLWVLPLYGERKPRPLLATPFNESGAQFSPDGKWIAYVSDESGRPEVLIRRFPPTEEKWQVSTVGGQQPRWRDDGKELFFIDTAGQLMASGISTGGEPSIRTPVPLFSARIPQLTLSGGRRALYAVSRDGRRFLVAERAEEGGGSISVLVGAETLGPQ